MILDVPDQRFSMAMLGVLTFGCFVMWLVILYMQREEAKAGRKQW